MSVFKFLTGHGIDCRKNNKAIVFLFLVLGIIIFFAVCFNLYIGLETKFFTSSVNSLFRNQKWVKKDSRVYEAGNCAQDLKKHTVNGESMSGIFKAGEAITADYGYYQCHEIRAGDAVIYNYSQERNPLLKIVRAVAGDSFSLKETGAGGEWNIFVNNKIVANSRSVSYVLDERKSAMLRLYERDYGGVIPEECCLIMGNLAGGSLDSTAFGIVSNNDILAKVID